ncbi:MAG: LbtU family siderophore porin [Deltaproteobacteria bacterium]|nr:LbtU family siderophore porin [Deltaproteobacteria bacterium]MBZ0219223.1 LbtU family siderophore porin [Deltaproteobacteria bacterium]
MRSFLNRLSKAAFLALVPGVLAFTPQLADADELSDLNERVLKIEKTQAELYHTLEEKKEPGLKAMISDRIQLGGLLEVEAHVDSNDVDGNSSDITLATFELAIDAKINDRVRTHVLFLWEEDETDFVDIDEGTIIIDLAEGVSLTAGKMYLPFGVFESHFISDPLTLELGETNETALLVSYSAGPLGLSAGAFRGSVAEQGDEDNVRDYVLSASYAPNEDIVLSAFYLSDIADSDAGLFDTNITPFMTDTVAGWGAFASITKGAVQASAEYISAVKRFDPADLASVNAGGDKPMAYNLEVAYDVSDKLEVAAKYEGSDDFAGFPKRQYGAAASYALFENVSTSIEFLHGEFADNAGDRDLVTVQLAVQF